MLVGTTRLILVPHLELHYLPFAALLDPASGRYLVERYELTETPSASIWVALGERRRASGTGGVLALAPRPDALPASLTEVRGIAQLARSSTTVLTGPAASESAFRRAAPSSRTLHLATYGVLNKENPLFSYVELGADASHDGRLDVHEVFGLDLSADLVVLSACETGVGSGLLADVPAGDDWVGLTRAFLQAGAGASWPACGRWQSSSPNRSSSRTRTTCCRSRMDHRPGRTGPGLARLECLLHRSDGVPARVDLHLGERGGVSHLRGGLGRGCVLLGRQRAWQAQEMEPRTAASSRSWSRGAICTRRSRRV